MKNSSYFKTEPYCIDGTPTPDNLKMTVKRIIRFEEIDPMNVVWHGRYPSYFEDARVAFGKHFGIGYSTLMQEETPAPVKHMFIDYIHPLIFGQTCSITIQLHWSEAARMNYSYQIHNEEGVLTTTGYTVQMFITKTGEFLLEQPPFYADFCQRWKQGLLNQ